MTIFFRTRVVLERSVLGSVVAFGMCALISCQPPPASNDAGAASSGSMAARIETHPTSGPIRDLSQDEAAGGHILRKHVGQTDDELRGRLERERGITGASTYTNRSVAEHTVGAAIAESH